MGFDFNISPGGGNPIFKQIVDQVRLAVATGKLSPGDALPSVRGLAEKLLVNPNTIAKAYGELSRDGYLDGQQGRGVFIARPRQVYTKAERLRRLGPHVEALVNEGISMGFSEAEIVEAVKECVAKANDLAPSRRKSS